MDDVTIFAEDRIFEPANDGEGANSIIFCENEMEAVGGKCTTDEEPKNFKFQDKGQIGWNHDERKYPTAYECIFSTDVKGSYNYHIEVHCK